MFFSGLWLMCVLPLWALGVSRGDALVLSPSQAGPVYTQKLCPGLNFQWQVDYSNKVIIAEVTYLAGNESSDSSKDWIAIGFSDYGQLQDADMCVMWTDWRGRLFLQDTHTNENETLLNLDARQDCNNFRAQPFAEGIVFTYTRAFDTCHQDNDDYTIEDGTTHVVWSIGQGPLYSLDGVDVADEGTTVNGFSRIRLLKVETPDKFPDDSQNLEIRHTLDLPSDDTTYWCSVHKLPKVFEQKHHIVQYEPVISEDSDGIVHHMEVFHCTPLSSDSDQSFPLWAGPCGSDSAPAKLTQCKKVLAAWAIGAGPFTYPEEAGLAIGGPEFGGPYIMLEVHYNNEELLSGVKDNSGMKMVITKELRPHDAGIMELGLVYTNEMAIPPGQSSFPLHSYCLPECSAVGFSESGIHIFGSQLHTHGTGVKVATKHYRSGIEQPEINRDNHYSTHFQEIRPLRDIRTVLPGDELVTTCWYDTRQRANITLGGFSFADEMCLNYIHYYPRTESLEVCKSAVDLDALNDYFEFLNKFDGQPTNVQMLNVSGNYRSIDWTPLRSDGLESFYYNAPVSMQCQSSAGRQMPGKWTGMWPPKVQKALPVPPRDCAEDKKPFDLAPANKQSSRQSDLLTRAALDQYLKARRKKANVGSMKKKRVGSPMNEMKRSQDKYIYEMEQQLEQDNDIIRKLTQQEGRTKKTPSIEKVTPQDDGDDWSLTKRVVAKKSPDIRKRQPGDQSDSDKKKRTGILRKRQDIKDFMADSVEDLEIPEWSDYDTWGYDKKKKKKEDIRLKKSPGDFGWDEFVDGPTGQDKKKRTADNNDGLRKKKMSPDLNKDDFMADSVEDLEIPEWSDYDTFGYDRKKRQFDSLRNGLGSMRRRRKKKSPSDDVKFA